MGAGTHAADALDKGPGVARVAALENHFQTAPHGAGGHRIGDDVLAVQVHLAAHMAFDAVDRVHHHAAAAIVQREPLCCVTAHYLSSAWVVSTGLRSCFFRAVLLSALTAACAAMAAPTPPAAVRPMASALASMPNCGMPV